MPRQRTLFLDWAMESEASVSCLRSAPPAKPVSHCRRQREDSAGASAERVRGRTAPFYARAVVLDVLRCLPNLRRRRETSASVNMCTGDIARLSRVFSDDVVNSCGERE
jgi:hypothetical protein